MGYKRLYKNLIDIIKEEQAKLGFRRESIRLYYPLSSLNHFFETQDTEEQMKNRLHEIPDFIKETLGDIKVTSKKKDFVSTFQKKAVTMSMKIQTQMNLSKNW